MGAARPPPNHRLCATGCCTPQPGSSNTPANTSCGYPKPGHGQQNWKPHSTARRPQTGQRRVGTPVVVRIVANTNPAKCTANGAPTDTHWETNMPWTNQAPLRDPRAGLAAATCDAPSPEAGYWVYAIGGQDAPYLDTVATAEAYDTSAKTWSTIAPMPTRRAYLAATSSPGQLYALGGQALPVALTHEEFNDAVGSTRRRSPSSSPTPSFKAPTTPSNSSAPSCPGPPNWKTYSTKRKRGPNRTSERPTTSS